MKVSRFMLFYKNLTFNVMYEGIQEKKKRQILFKNATFNVIA
jgi:hypothetical protein